MSIEEDIRARIAETIPGSRVNVGGDGYRWQVEVVSDRFQGLTRVKRQQLVYAAIGPLVQSGSVHAVTIVARTESESA